jgi:hypothetical protein
MLERRSRRWVNCKEYLGVRFGCKVSEKFNDDIGIIGVKTSFLLWSSKLLYYSVSTSPFDYTLYHETEEI